MRIANNYIQTYLNIRVNYSPFDDYDTGYMLYVTLSWDLHFYPFFLCPGFLVHFLIFFFSYHDCLWC